MKRVEKFGVWKRGDEEKVVVVVLIERIEVCAGPGRNPMKYGIKCEEA